MFKVRSTAIKCVGCCAVTSCTGGQVAHYATPGSIIQITYPSEMCSALSGDKNHTNNLTGENIIGIYS